MSLELALSHPERVRALFVTDGTPAGTRMVQDISPGVQPSEPWLFALAGESTPPGRVDVDGLALRLRTTEERVAEALSHLWRKGLIRYTRRVAE